MSRVTRSVADRPRNVSLPHRTILAPGFVLCSPDWAGVQAVHHGDCQAGARAGEVLAGLKLNLR